ncbi:MAG: protein kinase domain-containing protein [Gammaproteobacteria bacterium]
MASQASLSGAFEQLSALELPEQEVRLRELDAESPALAQRLRLLLAAHRETDALLDRDLLDQCARLFADFEPETLVGRMLGCYRLDALLGEGGMSVVYRATRQLEGVEQPVALKLLALPRFDRRTAEQFTRESIILARLEHPGIGRLLDWGRTDEGWPFLAIELVRGEPIDAWCQSRGTDLDGKLELLEQVAGSMAYAHQNLVVHLDLKPGNILVNEQGRPMVVDFGISTVLAENAGAPQATLARWLTPDYASPEQIAGRAPSVAADIYALGVILYELVTGKRPFDFAGTPTLASLSVIERGPVPPSQLAERVPRDLDAVCLKALHIDPGQRYASMDAFAEDLAAVRESRPVRARPDRVSYRLRKALERHPVSIPSAALAAMLIIGLAGLLLVQSVDLRAQRDRAEHERLRAETVTDFLVDSIAAVNPRTLSETGIGLAELLEVTTGRLARDPPEDPQLRFALYEQIARARTALGKHEASLEAVNLALDAQPGLEARARLLGMKAAALRSLSRLDEALAAADEAVAVVEADGAVIFENRRRRAQVLERLGRFDEAEAYSRQSLALLSDEDRVRRAHIYTDLATIALARMDLAAVEEFAAQALALYREAYDEPHVDTSDAAWRLAIALMNTGRAGAATELLDEVLSLRIALFGAGDHRVGEVHYVLSHGASFQGRAEVAAEHAGLALEIYRRELAPGDPRLMAAIGNMGTMLRDLGEDDEALAFLEEAIALGASIHGDPFHPDMGAFQNQLAEIHIARGEFEPALAISATLLPLFIEMAGEPSVPTAMIRRNLAEVYRRQGSFEEALAHARSAASQAAAIYPPGYGIAAVMEAELGWCLIASHALEEADEIATRLGEWTAAAATEWPENERRRVEAFLADHRATRASNP